MTLTGSVSDVREEETPPDVGFIPGDPEGTPRGLTLFITKLICDLDSFLELSL